MGNKNGQEQDREAPTADEDQVTVGTDYQSELPKKSTSARAAQAGEAAVAATQDQPSPFRLPGLNLSPEHAFEKEEEFRGKAKAYNLSRLGKGTGAAAYRNLTEQANAYQADGAAIEQANEAYIQLVPQSAFAFDSVVRFKAIQEQLGLNFSDNSMWTVGADDLSRQVGDRKAEFAQGVSNSGMKKTHGVVSDAARDFKTAQQGLVAALLEVRGHKMHEVIKKLEAERAEESEKKEKIEAAIESAHSVTEFAGKALSISGDAYQGGHELAAKEHEAEAEHGHEGTKTPKEPSAEERVEHREGAFEVATSVDEAAGVALGVIMHAIHDEDLAKISTQLASLNSELSHIEGSKALVDAQAIQAQLDHAKGAYTAALRHYENAIANQRNAYAEAGAIADQAHAHGGSLTHGNDKASQTMLFISAARETDLVLRSALPLGEQAEDRLRETLRGMRHRVTPYLESDWESGTPEGSRGEDQEAAQQAFALTSKWVAATKKELAAFDPIEEASRAMLQQTGKITGEY